jgi:hypothetical protein
MMAENAQVRAYRVQAEEGDATAQFALGHAFATGTGVQRDFAQAHAWYLKAAAQGHSGAQHNLGCIYDSGQGVSKNAAEAAKWFLVAAQNGSPLAQNNIGISYETGAGVVQSRNEALRWYKAAANQGSEAAKKNLERLLASPVTAAPPPLSIDQSRRPTLPRSRKLVEHCLPLLEASTPTVYRHNAFRITGLAVDATPRELKRRLDDLRAAHNLGDADEEHTHAFALAPPPTIEQIREAAQRLHDPERRIVEEFFWFWPEQWGGGKTDDSLRALSNGDKGLAFRNWTAAISDEHGRTSVIAKHNLAVLYQLTALDLEHYALTAEIDSKQLQTISKYWRTCFQYWEELTEDEIFWSLISDRIRILDDPRLTTGFARRMRLTLPEAMDKINAMLAISFIELGKHERAEKHFEYMVQTHQGQDDVAGTMALVTQPLLKRLRSSIDHAERTCNTAPSAADIAVQNLVQVALEPVRILKRFLPSDDPQLLDTCDAIANTCLRCHHAVLRTANDDHARWDAGIAILRHAEAFAQSEETIADIAEAELEAVRRKRLAHPQARQINNLLYRAMSEPLAEQLETLGTDVARALSALYNETGGLSPVYTTAVDTVAGALRALSVDLVNKGQEHLSRAWQASSATSAEERRVLGLAALAGHPGAVMLQEVKWQGLMEIAVGIDLYDRGNTLAHSPELRQQFAADTEALGPLRALCQQVANDLYVRRVGKGLLFKWGSQQSTPPSRPSSSGSGCYVATAVYGSYDHPSVIQLRGFRDNTLMRTSCGRLVVDMYYSVAPKLAGSIARHPMAIATIRRGLEWLVTRLTDSEGSRDDATIGRTT